MNLESYRTAFENLYVPEPNSGCWLWTGSLKGKGYGHFWLGKSIRAHRASWLLHVGEIPTNKYVLHKCDVRICVNPDHLFLGTNRDNSLDCVKKGRHQNAALSDEQVSEIRASKLANRHLRAIHNVSASTVCKIRQGKRYLHVSVEKKQ